MKLQNNTILITGGSSGIGFELSRTLLHEGNTVLICSRSLEKLEKAKKELSGLHIFQCDISKQFDRDRLYEWISENHPECNVLVNNAAIVNMTDFYSDEKMIEKSEQEIQTNLMAPIILTKMFLPVIERNSNPTVINITTGLVYAPKAAYLIYNATKAAMHSFTQVLRMQLNKRSIDIIEVLMPPVDTPWHNGKPPKRAITVEKAVAEMLITLENGKKVIKVAVVNILYFLSRVAPSFALKKVNEL